MQFVNFRRFLIDVVRNKSCYDLKNILKNLFEKQLIFGVHDQYCAVTRKSYFMTSARVPRFCKTFNLWIANISKITQRWIIFLIFTLTAIDHVSPKTTTGVFCLYNTRLFWDFQWNHFYEFGPLLCISRWLVLSLVCQSFHPGLYCEVPRRITYPNLDIWQ